MSVSHIQQDAWTIDPPFSWTGPMFLPGCTAAQITDETLVVHVLLFSALIHRPEAPRSQDVAESVWSPRFYWLVCRSPHHVAIWGFDEGNVVLEGTRFSSSLYFTKLLLSCSEKLRSWGVTWSFLGVAGETASHRVVARLAWKEPDQCNIPTASKQNPVLNRIAKLRHSCWNQSPIVSTLCSQNQILKDFILTFVKKK